MTDNLQTAINALSLHDEEPVDLPDSPRFHVFDENATSLLGRLLNPDCQAMDKMIEEMPRIWRAYERVRGIALSRDKFQFIFEREEDLMTVLKDRPWTYNNWTMLLDRWIPSPPANFLTTVDVWIRISRIPVNHYRLETMDFLASKVSKVPEIAYDPKASQKEAYIRAQVRLDIANPEIAIKPLNLPKGGRVIIEFEYEKLRKRCFHCQRLTHERPSCPFLKNRGSLPTATDVAKDTRDKEKPEASGGILKKKPLLIEHPVVPPGFAPLFPEMPPIERNMALQYISHSDPTERQARITRVQQSFQPGFEDNVGRAPRISHDINKGKGHVFNFQEQDRPGKRATLASERPPFSEADIIRGKDRDGFLLDNLEAFSSSSSLGPTVFRVGTYTGNFSTGANEVVKKSRRRPQRWKRICSQRPTGLFRP
ncbi:PREDICTED: uncharacterized protein LOC106303004 [Brassica oleracea var. oleracea]|uniref:uncharacterized protein LOC106303004 n=1 Tax=Brassica oleracea var. oleracea TaxID=109376 RepID=UPI0006A6A726|nr:PREDICTED: uncharacterized protein LOC106303004 [Brassica oleracea var. oleracea]